MKMTQGVLREWFYTIVVELTVTGELSRECLIRIQRPLRQAQPGREEGQGEEERGMEAAWERRQERVREHCSKNHLQPEEDKHHYFNSRLMNNIHTPYYK